MKTFNLKLACSAFLSFILFLSLFGCNKDELKTDTDTELLSREGKPDKIDICHYSADDDQWILINIKGSSWADHVLHGDVRLDDQDGDGYVTEANECGLPVDCDDTDSSKTDNCCVVITPLTDANIHQAVQLWLSNQASAEATYGHISNWCTSDITDMTDLFLGSSFNEDISGWDVSNVTSMETMFSFASSFNQPIGNWDVSSVTNMYYMFWGATSFNQPIGNWDMRNAATTEGMFWGASSFNQPIGNWDVSSVTNMETMFRRASSFNQDLSDWDVTNVTNMWGMFYSATSFNQDLSGWCVSNIPSEPINFDLGATVWTEARPVWGTCPI